MKYFIILLTICMGFVTPQFAQETHKKSYPTTDIEVIKIDVEYGDMKVTFGDVEELQINHNITVNGSYNSNMIDISKKVKNGVLDISYSFDFEEVEQRVTLTDDNGNKQVLSISEYNKIKNSLRNYNNMNFGYDIDGEITLVIPINKTLRLSTTYGDMDIVHSNPKKEHDLEFHSTYGHIDLSIPENTSSNIELLTSYGEIYSDLKFESSSKGSSKNCQHGENIIATLSPNSKGTIALEATYDNIYLRKI